MAYVGHAFFIFYEDIMMEISYIINNGPLVKEIALTVSLFVFGLVKIILGSFMTYNRIGGDRGHAQREKILDKQIHSLIEQLAAKQAQAEDLVSEIHLKEMELED